MGNGQLKVRLDDELAWSHLHAGQYVVFLSNCDTDVLLDGDGRVADDRTSVPVFDSLAAAREYAQTVVSAEPPVCASIYGHDGRSGDPILRVYHESLRRRFDPAHRARRDTWIGLSFLGAFTVWAVISTRSDEHFLWFYLLGMKLLTLGTVLSVRGITFFIGRRGAG